MQQALGGQADGAVVQRRRRLDVVHIGTAVLGGIVEDLCHGEGQGAEQHPHVLVDVREQGGVVIFVQSPCKQKYGQYV